MLTVKHAFVSPKADGVDPTIVRPSNWNADHLVTGNGQFIPGMVIDFVGHTDPPGFVEGYGQSIAAIAAPDLFAAMVKQQPGVTITVASPGVVTWALHGLPVFSKVRFTTTGALPTGLAVNTDYYINATGYTANSFRLSATPGGVDINTSGTQSGTHTGISAAYGVANDLSTFSVPDLRGRVTAGSDIMGGTAANRLTVAESGITGGVVGASGGVQSVALATTQIPAHGHSATPGAVTVTVNSGGAHTHTLSGSTSSAGTHSHITDLIEYWTGFNGSDGSRACLQPTHQAGTIGVTNYGTTSDGAHTHTLSGSAASGGAHTHTASGTIAAFTTGNAGGGLSHSNVQPTLIVRKLVFTG